MNKLFVTKSGYDYNSNVEFVKKILVMEESPLNGMGFGETFVTIDYERLVQLLQTVDHLVCKVDSLTKRVEQLEKQK